MKSRVSIRFLLFLFIAFVSHSGFGDAIGAPAEPLLFFTQAPVTGSVAESPPASSLDGISNAPQATPSSPIQQIPAKAHAVLKAIQDRGGEPPSDYVGGRTFQNRERRLPRGHYREYDVNPNRPGKNRGSERIVIERRTGKAYYTGDHYRTFVPMN
jgi:guanyl-specific ribonuclease Sa